MANVFLYFERKPSPRGDEVYGAYYNNFYFIILLSEGLFSCAYSHEGDTDEDHVFVILQGLKSYREAYNACERKAMYVLN